MYRKYMSNPDYDCRICGMHPNVAEKIREIRSHPKENLASQADTIFSSFAAQLPTELREHISFALGSAMKEEFVSGKIDSDILLYLLSDPTNIDSKMITCIKNTIPGALKEAAFKSLYKFDASNLQAASVP